MTVKDLKELLDKFDDNAVIEIQNGDDGGDYDGSREIYGISYENGLVIC